MELKTCLICKKELTLDCFDWKNEKKGWKHSWCKDCKKEYNKKYYQKNKRYFIDKAKERKKEYNLWKIVLKKNIECTVCGESHSACLEFHHLSPEEKDRSISFMVNRQWGKKKILDEIKKCEVLCSNCHRKLHWSMNQKS